MLLHFSLLLAPWMRAEIVVLEVATQNPEVVTQNFDAPFALIRQWHTVWDLWPRLRERHAAAAGSSRRRRRLRFRRNNKTNLHGTEHPVQLPAVRSRSCAARLTG